MYIHWIHVDTEDPKKGAEIIYGFAARLRGGFSMSVELLLMLFLIFLSVVLLYRVVVGPQDMDRIVAMSTISPIIAVVLALWSLEMRRGIYLDIALVLALLDFIMVVAYARYIRGSYSMDYVAYVFMP